jgi:imidazolonepropionase-like amidohydrolase
MTRLRYFSVFILPLLVGLLAAAAAQSPAPPVHPIVLHAARLLDIKSGRIVKPGEVLVQGERIVEAGTSVKHPAGAEAIDLGDRTLLPGLIDAHVHLFLHPGAEDSQTVRESVPQRMIAAQMAAMTAHLMRSRFTEPRRVVMASN